LEGGLIPPTAFFAAIGPAAVGAPAAAAAPMVGGSQVRLYDAGETAKFLTLRERIDEQLDTHPGGRGG